MNEIIVIRVADPDGSLFQTIVDALNDKRSEIIHVTAPFSAVLRIGELEINHEHRRVLMAAGKCGSTMASMPFFPVWPKGQVGFTQKSNSMLRRGTRPIPMVPVL